MPENKLPDPIELEHPFDFQGQKVTTVSFKRRLKVKDTLRLAKQFKEPSEYQLRMLVALTDLQPEAFDEMDAADYTDICSELESFLSSRRAKRE